MISKITKLTAVAVASFLSVEMATAQVSEYTFEQTQGTYTDLANPIEIAKATALLGKGSLDTVPIKIEQLPFSFKYNNETYDQMYVCPKGYVFFGDERLECGTAEPIKTGLSTKREYKGKDYKGLISAFGSDIMSKYTQANASTISYEVTGVAPNRAMTIQWKSFAFTGAGAGTATFGKNEDFNIQMTLFENGKIQFVYDIRNIMERSATFNYYVQVGLRGTSNQDYNNRVADGTAFNNWNSSLQGTSNADGIKTNGKLPAPSTGLTFTYTPPTETLATNDVKAEDNAVKISPNPVGEIFNIVSKEGIVSYEVVDTTGKRVAYGTNSTANVSNLPKGVYIVKVKGKDNKITTQKIIKK